MAKQDNLDKNFRRFKKYCRHYLKLLSLQSFEVHFSICQMEGRAQCRADGNAGQIATLSLSEDFGPQKIPKEELRRIAFHEVCELLLHDLELNARTRYTTSYEIEKSKHEAIRRLEHFVFGHLLKSHTQL